MVQKTKCSRYGRRNHQRKILELGCNWGGKSTIFKSVKFLYQGYDEEERIHYKEIIFSNIIYSMKLLIECALKSESTSKEEKKLIAKHGELLIDINGIYLNSLAEYPNILKRIPALWELPSIRKAYAERNRTFHIPEVEMWFNDMERILKPDYIPTEQDVLLSRVKTTGIVCARFQDQENDAIVYDVGSERNERKKWYSCFDSNVTDLIYVVGTDEFDLLCYEDNQTNRLEESLDCWSEICNSHFFLPEKVNIFLVFNKADLFKNKIQNSTASLGQCFKDYRGENVVRNALSNIVNRFLSVVRYHRRIFVCVTNALDRNCMTQFWRGVLATPTPRTKGSIGSKGDFLFFEEWLWSNKNNFSPRCYLSTNSVDVDITNYSDLKLSVPEYPNIQLRCHSYVLAVRCPLFYRYILQWVQKHRDRDGTRFAVLQGISLVNLKHILSYIYCDQPYPYFEIGDNEMERRDLQKLNQIFRFKQDPIIVPESPVNEAQKDNGFSKSMVSRFVRDVKNRIKRSFGYSVQNGNSSNLPPRLYTKPDNSIKSDELRKAFINLNLTDTGLFIGSEKSSPITTPRNSIKEQKDKRGTMSLIISLMCSNEIGKQEDNPMKSLSIEKNNGDYTYDLLLYVEGKKVKTHKFILGDRLPLYTGSDHFVFPFISYKSCMIVLSFLYDGSKTIAEILPLELLRAEDIVELITIVCLWYFENNVLECLLRLLPTYVTPENVGGLVDFFEEDHIDMSKFIDCYVKNLPQEPPKTMISELPNDILFIIYSFLASPPEEEKINQDELLFLTCMPSDFLIYMKQYYSNYLIWKTPSTNFATLRNILKTQKTLLTKKKKPLPPIPQNCTSTQQ